MERFIDWMVKDVNTGDCFRADHLIKNNLEELMKVHFVKFLLSHCFFVIAEENDN